MLPVDGVELALQICPVVLDAGITARISALLTFASCFKLILPVAVTSNVLCQPNIGVNRLWFERE